MLRNVNPSEPILAVNIQIAEKTGVPPEEQRLIWGGKQLETHRMLSDYGDLHGSTINMVLRLRGGLMSDSRVNSTDQSLTLVHTSVVSH